MIMSFNELSDNLTLIFGYFNVSAFGGSNHLNASGYDPVIWHVQPILVFVTSGVYVGLYSQRMYSNWILGNTYQRSVISS